MKKNKKERRLELSSKFLEMGQSLVNEGFENSDYCVSQSGNIMIFIAGLLMNEDDMFEYSKLCSMFSAKKILDDLENNESDLTNYLNDKSNTETYNDIIKKINKIRKDNGEPPLA